MKKMILLLCAVCSLLSAGEYKAVRNAVLSGKKEMRFTPNGHTFLIHGKKAYVTGSLTIGTKGGYFTFASPKTGRKYSNPDKGFWQWTGTFPGDKKGAKVNFTQSFELTPHGSVEGNISWKAADLSNVKDTFYCLRFSMADLKGKSFMFNGQKVQIPNITKYGFFRKDNVENPELVFFSGDKARSFSVQGEGKVTVVLQAIKDKSVMVRFYPERKGSNMKLIFKM